MCMECMSWKHPLERGGQAHYNGNDVIGNLACRRMFLGQYHYCTTKKPARQPVACLPGCFRPSFRISIFHSPHGSNRVQESYTTTQQNQPTLGALIPSQISFLYLSHSQAIPVMQANGCEAQGNWEGSGMTRASCFVFVIGILSRDSICSPQRGRITDVPDVLLQAIRSIRNKYAVNPLRIALFYDTPLICKIRHCL